MDGDGDGGDDGRGGSVDGTTSGSGIHSIRMKTALLAIESQHLRQCRRIQNGDLLMSSEPPIRHTNRLYGHVRWRRQCGRIKIVPAKVSQVQKVEKTYLECISAMQPRGNDPKHAYMVVGPRCRRGRIKIKSAKLKIQRFNDKRQQNGENTYQRCKNATQPPWNAPKRRYGAHRHKRQCGRIKFKPRNINQMRISRNAYLGRANALRSIWRPRKQNGRISKLTFKFRMQGERRRDVEDYG